MEKIINIERLQHDCPLCDKVHEVEMIKRIVSSTINGCVVNHEEVVFRCPLRNEEWYHGKMLDDTLSSMRDAYCLKKNLLAST